MTSVLPGASTLDVEVTNVSTHGFRLMLGTEELFVPFPSSLGSRTLRSQSSRMSSVLNPIVSTGPTSMSIWPSIPFASPRSFRWLRDPAPNRRFVTDAFRAAQLERWAAIPVGRSP